jgi:hypothetical protein
MEYFRNMVCVTKEDLTSPHPLPLPSMGGEKGCEAVMSEACYRNLTVRNQMRFVRRGGGLETYALIEYGSLPVRFRKRFEALKGDPVAALKNQLLPEAVPLNLEARRWFAEFTFADGSYLSLEKQDEYTMNASVLDLLIRELNDRSSLRKACGKNSTRLLWETVAGTVERFRKSSGHTLPAHLVNLKEKINDYRRYGFEALISGKFGNRNTLKITDEAGRFIIAMKRSRTPVFTNEQIFVRFNLECERRKEIKEFRDGRDCGDGGDFRDCGDGGEWKALRSINSLTGFLKRPEVMPLWWDAVHGELAAKQLFQRNHKTVISEKRNALWYGDGTKLNLWYRKFVPGKGWVKASVTVYEVIDAYSEVLLGYHISERECFEQQYNAFRMAVERTKERPFEIVVDNQGEQKTKRAREFFGRIAGHVARYTAPHNPQSKTIESAFGRFQAQVLHQWYGFTGQNVTAKKASSKPNVEFVDANIEGLPTLEELKVRYREAREMWNGERVMITTGVVLKHPKFKDSRDCRDGGDFRDCGGKTRVEVYDSSPNEMVQAVDELDLMELFWVTTERASTFTSSGITISVSGKGYTYEPLDADGMPDMEFRRKHTLREFFVQYDPLDMSRVRLFMDSPTGRRYVATAYPYVEVHRDIQGRSLTPSPSPNGEGGGMSEDEFIRRQDDVNKRVRIEASVFAYGLEAEYGVAPEQHGLRRAKLAGISARDWERLGDCGDCRDSRDYRDNRDCGDVGSFEDWSSVGEFEKEISLMTYDEAAFYDKF